MVIGCAKTSRYQLLLRLHFARPSVWSCLYIIFTQNRKSNFLVEIGGGDKVRQGLYLLLLSALMIVSAGCNGAHEADHLAYVVAIGMDKGENNEIIVTYQMAIPRQLNGSAGGSDSGDSTSGGGPAKNFENITISGFSIAETRNELKSVVALTPVFYHTKLIVFGDSLAKSGLGEVLGPLLRFREYRGSMYVAVAKGTAQKFLEKNQPAITGSTAKYYEMMLQSDLDSGLYLSTSLHNFYRDAKEYGSDSYALYVASNPEVKAKVLSADSKEKPGGNAEVPKLAGEISRIGGDSAEFLGTAIFSGDKMTGLLDSSQTRLVSLFLTRLNSSYVVIDDIQPGIKEKKITLRFRAEGPPEVKTEIVEGKAVAHIHLELAGEITSVASGINYENPEYREQLESRLSQLFTQDFRQLIFHLQECDSDVLGIGDYFRPKFATLPEFIDFDWKGHFKDAQIDGDIQFKIRRTGLMWKTNPIEE
jgi:Ger(x)C family germination protein